MGRMTRPSPTGGAPRCGASRRATASTPPTSCARSVPWAGSAADVASGVATVTVRYFAAAAEAAGLEEETLAAADAGTTVGELRDLLVDRYGAAMARVVAN